MTIAVHIAVPDLQNDARTNFNFQVFTLVAAAQPAHHFVFIFDKQFDVNLITAKNITPVIQGPQIKNRLLQHYFYNFKIPRLLNKYHVDCFISADVCSLRTNTEQLLILHDLSFLQKKNLFDRSDIRYLKKYTKSFVKKAAKIVVLNPALKIELENNFATAESTINIITSGVDETYQSLSYEKADLLRETISGGKQYFIAFSTAASTDNMITVLKAFSIFKKWQKSNMQLLIISSTEKAIFKSSLSSYKHRDDVKIIHAAGLDPAIIAAAYATIHLTEMEITETEGLQSLGSGVPFITFDNGFNKNIYKDGAVYTKLIDKDIAEKMMLLYKDEQARTKTIQQGKQVMENHSWKNTAAQLWEIIQADEKG